MSLEAALLAAIGACASAIVAQWLWFRSLFADLRKDLAQCHLEKDELWERLAELEDHIPGRATSGRRRRDKADRTQP